MAADEKLNKTCQSLIKLVRNQGDDWVDDLREGQRKWIDFLDLNCEFYGNYFKGKLGESLYNTAYIVRMRNERESELGKKRVEMNLGGCEEKSKYLTSQLRRKHDVYLSNR